MKTGFITFGAFALLPLVAVQPRSMTSRAQLIYTTITAAAVIVYVDTDGVPHTTSTIDGTPETTSTSEAALSSTSNLSSSPSSCKMASTQFPEAVEAAAVTSSTTAHSTPIASSSPAVKSYGIVRIYGVDCDQVANSLPSAINNGQNIQKYTVSAMVDALNWARGNLTNVHYTTLVNCHAFLDPNTAAADAGTFVKGRVANVQYACPNKKVIVTESGWPKQGNTDGKAVPSPANQKAALSSLRI
ncbi:glycoside hydrolase family 17 protein [Cenococcum geophilum 1.58]|uniref:glycoside hydrolase family 17 protein n=1 Tax=Cenococcum geophilum 1.58 TaxID=794803 RepID=UPI00358E74AD|nr:glycoside hydrolase family 17 protein [Cenococcum geophilum 1.58]